MTLKQIETAISQLSTRELAQFREWFAHFDADLWDNEFERDVQNGKLDRLADQALEHARSNRCTPL